MCRRPCVRGMHHHGLTDQAQHDRPLTSSLVSGTTAAAAAALFWTSLALLAATFCAALRSVARRLRSLRASASRVASAWRSRAFSRSSSSLAAVSSLHCSVHPRHFNDGGRTLQQCCCCNCRRKVYGMRRLTACNGATLYPDTGKRVCKAAGGVPSLGEGSTTIEAIGVRGDKDTLYPSITQSSCNAAEPSHTRHTFHGRVMYLLRTARGGTNGSSSASGGGRTMAGRASALAFELFFELGFPGFRSCICSAPRCNDCSAGTLRPAPCAHSYESPKCPATACLGLELTPYRCISKELPY